MSKKKTSPAKRRAWNKPTKNRKYMLIGCVCAIILLAFGALAGPWSTFSGSRRLGSFFYPPPPPLPSPGNPSKEYIYASGRLIATEEASPLAPPGNLAASTISNAQIDISWSISPNAHHYVVERATQSGSFTTLNNNVTGTTFNDNTVTNLNAYLYRVRSADAVGNVSAVSNVDVATAITFEDDPFPDAPVLTPVRAQHILQLRQAINAVRHTVPGMPDYSWTQSITAGSTLIKANDIEELRTALDAALTALSLPAGGYTDSSLTNLLVQKLHIKELRDRVK